MPRCRQLRVDDVRLGHERRPVEQAGRVLARKVALGDGVALAAAFDQHRVQIGGRADEVRERAGTDLADELVDEGLQGGLRTDVDAGHPGGRRLARRGRLARDEQAVRPELVGRLGGPVLPRRATAAAFDQGHTSVNRPSAPIGWVERTEAGHDPEAPAASAAQRPVEVGVLAASQVTVSPEASTTSATRGCRR